MTEDLRPVLGFEDRYLISESGYVHSLSTNRALATAIESGRPYRYVTLWRDGRQYHRRIHALLLEAFVGPRPAGHFGLHYDDDVTNNALSNLRWGTRAENTLDMIRNGRHNNARKTHCKWDHPLTEDNVAHTKSGRVCLTCRTRRRAEYEQRQALAVLVADQEVS